MKYFIISFLSFVLLISAPSLAETFDIAAVVNDEAISMRDVEDRMKLVIISSGLPNNAQTRDRVMPQVINGLVEEQIKMQAGVQNKIEVTQKEIDAGFSTLASQNNFSADQFKKLLQQQGIPISTLYNQIKAQIFWSGVIQKVLRPRVNVTQTDVDDRLARLKAQLGKTEYLVSEIYLPVEEDDKESEVRNFANKLLVELKKGAPFPAVAAQFSKTPGAQNGGIIGWIQPGQLDPALDKALADMTAQSLSDPIRSVSGYHILWLQNKRNLSEDKIPAREDITNMIGMERLDREQQRYLTDLKASAFIDKRV